MNFLLSIGIFNPLEILVILLFMNLIENNLRIKKFQLIENIKHFYILGFLMYLIQCIPNLFIDNILYMILNIMVVFILMPIFTYSYFLIIQKRKNFFDTFIATMYNGVTVLISLFILSLFVQYLFLGEYNTIVEEVFINIFVKVIQVLFIYIIVLMGDICGKINFKIYKKFKE